MILALVVAILIAYGIIKLIPFFINLIDAFLGGWANGRQGAIERREAREKKRES